jgi:hypothetical protein
MDSQGAKYAGNVPNVTGLSKAKNRYRRLKKSLYIDARYAYHFNCKTYIYHYLLEIMRIDSQAKKEEPLNGYQKTLMRMTFQANRFMYPFKYTNTKYYSTPNDNVSLTNETVMSYIQHINPRSKPK